jgi:DNA-binding XRE family transcriptional regulator
MRPTAYRRNARGLRDRQAFEHIRMQAGALFTAGRSQAEVARQLGVARQNVSRCASGFDTDHWTLERITTVIQQRTGHRYHPGHTWKLLRRMGWRLQRPARRAVERDTQAIARWVAEDWP